MASLHTPANQPATYWHDGAAVAVPAMLEPDTTPDFTFINRYWRDPSFAASVNAEGARDHATAMAAIDRGMSALNAKQAARWAAEAGA